MKIRTIVLTVALCLVGVPVGFAQDAFMGVWKLNEAKSEFSPGAPKNSTVVYEAEGDKVKVNLRYYGREMAHQELGLKVLERVTSALIDIAMVEVPPKMEGRQMIMVLAPKKKK